MEAGDRFRFAKAIATDEEIVDLAVAVFFSSESEQARQLAAYVIERFDPGREITAVEAEIARMLGKMASGKELLFRFPNLYRKPDENTEGDGEYVPHRTCRKCRLLKPLERDYGITKNGNRKTKCLECEERDKEKRGR